MTAGTGIQALAVPGGRGRLACAQLAAVSAELTVALRRALPFLARRRVAVTATVPQCSSFADLAADVTIVHAAAFTVERRGATPQPAAARARGLLLVDESALARILDGVFGGDGSSSLGGAVLTSAQTALASRVSGAMLRAFAGVFSKLGIGAEATPSKDIDSGSAVVVALEMDGGGRIVVVLPLCVLGGDDATPTETIDPGIAAAMIGVELDVVAELGKVRLPLSAISNLQVGDVLRLTLPLDERARVCAGGSVLFHGRPTASGHVVAVALEEEAPRS